MDLQKQAPAARGDAPRGEGCLVVAVRVPVRIVVLVLVVPVRMAWDALAVAGRCLNGTALRPLGRAVLVRPSTGPWRYVLVPPGTLSARLGTVSFVLPAAGLHRRVPTPVGHALAWVYARLDARRARGRAGARGGGRRVRRARPGCAREGTDLLTKR